MRLLLFRKRLGETPVTGNEAGLRKIDPEIPDGMFYRAADFEKEDLWPMVGVQLEHIGKSGDDAASHKEKGRPRQRPRFLFRPVYAASALLIMAGVLLLLSRPDRNTREDAAGRPALPSPSRAIIESARIKGRPARIMTFVQPDAPEISLFWIGSQDN